MDLFTLVHLSTVKLMEEEFIFILMGLITKVCSEMIRLKHMDAIIQSIWSIRDNLKIILLKGRELKRDQTIFLQEPSKKGLNIMEFCNGSKENMNIHIKEHLTAKVDLTEKESFTSQQGLTKVILKVD